MRQACEFSGQYCISKLPPASVASGDVKTSYHAARLFHIYSASSSPSTATAVIESKSKQNKTAPEAPPSVLPANKWDCKLGSTCTPGLAGTTNSQLISGLFLRNSAVPSMCSIIAFRKLCCCLISNSILARFRNAVSCDATTVDRLSKRGSSRSSSSETVSYTHLTLPTTPYV